MRLDSALRSARPGRIQTRPESRGIHHGRRRNRRVPHRRLCRLEQPALDVGLPDVPLRDEPVRWRATMERTAGLAVNVFFVFRSHDAELGKIEVGVERLQRIERPFDELQAHLHRHLTLRQLQPGAKTGTSHVGSHPEHVRPLRGSALLDRGHRIHEPLHYIVRVERSEQDPAALDRDDQHRRRDNVFGVRISPHLTLERRNATAVFERRQRTNGERHVTCESTTAGEARAAYG